MINLIQWSAKEIVQCFNECIDILNKAKNINITLNYVRLSNSSTLHKSKLPDTGDLLTISIKYNEKSNGANWLSFYIPWSDLLRSLKAEGFYVKEAEDNSEAILDMKMALLNDKVKLIVYKHIIRRIFKAYETNRF